MFPYLVLMGIPTVMGIIEPRRASRLALVCTATFFFIFVGLRWETGSDWGGYAIRLQIASGLELTQIWTQPEPGFGALLWFSNASGLGHIGLNAGVALIFLWGLFSFARTTPSPWLAIAVATSYLVLALAMAGLRQAAAMGIIFLLFARWHDLGVIRKGLFVGAASLFHFSAIVILGLLPLTSGIRTGRKILLSLVVGVISILMIEADIGRTDEYVERYTGATAVVAPGALYHALLNGLPAGVFLIFYSRFRRVLADPEIVRVLALACVAMVPLAFIVSIAASRLSMYLTIPAMLIWAAAPAAFGRGKTRHLYTMLALFAQASVLVIWLQYANTAFAFLPYQNVLFMR